MIDKYDRGEGRIVTSFANGHKEEKAWDVSQKSRGLGDTVAKITHRTGIAKAAKIKEKITGNPCGCAKRQQKLNRILSYAN